MLSPNPAEPGSGFLFCAGIGQIQLPVPLLPPVKGQEQGGRDIQEGFAAVLPA